MPPLSACSVAASTDVLTSLTTTDTAREMGSLPVLATLSTFSSSAASAVISSAAISSAPSWMRIWLSATTTLTASGTRPLLLALLSVCSAVFMLMEPLPSCVTA